MTTIGKIKMAQYRKDQHRYMRDGDTLFEAVMLADKDGNIINSSGIASNIPIASGSVKGWSNIHKFGAVPLMSANPGYGSIWDKNDTLYPWSAFATPGILTVATTDANGSVKTNDDGLSIVISGLDENYKPITDTITISGGTGTGTQTFARVFRAYISNGDANANQWRVSRDGVEVLRINIGKAQTLMSIYTIPAGKTGYLLKSVATCGETGSDATVDMFIRYNGQNVFRIGHSAEVSTVGGQYTYEFAVPIQLPEKSDIDMRAIVRSNNTRITAAFDIILVDNDENI